ncbi:MAG: hypothetical protein RIT26_869 [Pseudomonadota bacterium]
MAATDFFKRWGPKPQALDEASEAAKELNLAQPPAPSDIATTPDQTEPQPPPTLAQARALTPADDFRPFVQAGVEPQVRNAAMKQLFADPHFNVMDGLDIYIDDYHTPNPLPASDISRMAGAQFLRLLQSEPQEEGSGRPIAATPAQASSPESTLLAENHSDDPDLRLQSNPETGPASPDPVAD